MSWAFLAAAIAAAVVVVFAVGVFLSEYCSDEVHSYVFGGRRFCSPLPYENAL